MYFVSTKFQSYPMTSFWYWISIYLYVGVLDMDIHCCLFQFSYISTIWYVFRVLWELPFLLNCSFIYLVIVFFIFVFPFTFRSALQFKFCIFFCFLNYGPLKAYDVCCRCFCIFVLLFSTMVFRCCCCCCLVCIYMNRIYM